MHQPARVGSTLDRLWLAAGLAVLLLLTGCQESLYTKLSEGEANELLAALSEDGIEARKVLGDDQTWIVSVDSSEFAPAVKALELKGLPRAKFDSMGKVFKKDSLYTSANEERIRYLYAVSQELNETLAQIDGVLKARVHPVLPANDPFSSQSKPSSASVFIKHRADIEPSVIKPQITRLVKNSLEGLQEDNIEVTFFPAFRSGADASAAKGQRTESTPWWRHVSMIPVLALAVALVGMLLWPRVAGLFRGPGARLPVGRWLASVRRGSGGG